MLGTGLLGSTNYYTGNPSDVFQPLCCDFPREYSYAFSTADQRAARRPYLSSEMVLSQLIPILQWLVPQQMFRGVMDVDLDPSIRTVEDRREYS